MDKVFYSRLKDEIKFPNKIFSNVIPKAIRKQIVNYFENHIWELTRDVNKSKVSKGVSFTLPCPSIFRNSIQEFILPHLLDFPIQNFKLHLSDPCVLYIVEPTMPHIDGHLVYGKEGGYLIKTILIPLCIIKNNNINFSFDNVIFTLFQQHLNYTASLGGLEFNKTFLRKKQIQEFKQTQFYERFIGKHYFNKAGIEDLPIEDNNGNTLLLNLQNSWITKQNIVFFRKMVDAYTDFREEASKVLPNLDLVLFNCLHGLTIENIYNFKDGEFLVQNPYQTHCSGDFKDFDAKLCLRLNLYINKK
jgi:hypothetical protein